MSSQRDPAPHFLVALLAYVHWSTPAKEADLVLSVGRRACLPRRSALFPQWDEWVDPATGDRVSERRLGLWFSPAHQSVRREPPQGGFTSRGGVNWLSWSSLLVVTGAVCFEAGRRRLRGAAVGSPHEANGGEH